MLRNASLFTLLILALIALLLANLLVWANRTVFDRQDFIATTNRVLDEESVQNEIAGQLSGSVEVYLHQRLLEDLPEDLTALGRVLAAAARDALHEATIALLQDDQARDALEDVLILLHDQVLRVIEGEDALFVQEGALVLDLRPLLERAITELGLEERPGGAELPESAGRLVLLDDIESYGEIQQILSHHDTITWTPVVLAVVLLGAVAVVSRTRYGLRRIASALLIAGVVALLIILPLRAFATLMWDDDTVASAFDAFLRDYRLQSALLVVLAAVLLAADAWLARSEITEAVRTAIRPRSGERAPDWTRVIHHNIAEFRAGGLVAGAVLLALWPEPSERAYLTIVALVAGLLAALWFIDSQVSVEERTRTDAANTRPGLRHLNLLRTAGVVLPLLGLAMLPAQNIEAVAGILTVALAYLAVVEWLGRPAARQVPATDAELLTSPVGEA